MKVKKCIENLPESAAKLKSLSPSQLQELWARYFASGRPQFKPLWFKIQCERGGLVIEQKHVTKLNACSENPDESIERSHKTKYHVKPGTQLLKKFKGKDYMVHVTAPDEFNYENQTYKSLSAIATLICGHKVSGYDFFGFNNKGA
ncbi:MAG: DUF2924 domain-containing protein [Rickettsiales bacterium]|jgi:hypothetical protein|nr:DUF2924 domain-containing protein [Rickettsiales bacterium]